MSQEREEKDLAFEREKIISFLKSQEAGLLNDILLDHFQALDMTASEIYESLGLKWLELGTSTGYRVARGTKEITPSRKLIEETFPIRFEGKTYGTLRVAKELWILGGESNIFSDKRLYATAFLMAVLFAMIRLFIRRQIITPINSLIESCALRDEEGSPSRVQGNSVEMENLVHSFHEMRARIAAYQQKAIEMEKKSAKVTLASQVVHDIRSPLVALSLMDDVQLKELSEEKRIIIRSAVTRIQDIANDLILKNQPEGQEGTQETIPDVVISAHPPETTSKQLLSSLIDSIVSEQRFLYQSRLGIEIKTRIDSDSYGLFARVHPADFKRVLSNLMNNSVQAMGDSGQVEVRLNSEGETVTITVGDNGPGIAKEILDRVTEEGFSFGKTEGTGRGLGNFFREALEFWNAKFEIESEVGIGTSVKLSIPKEAPPDWFVPRLEVPRDGEVVILDDDRSIHQIWQKRLQGLEGGGGCRKIPAFFDGERDYRME